jgi:hypothetical protein
MIITFARSGQEAGQYHEDEVPSLLASGEILPSDDYWHEGLDDWRKVSERWSAPQLAKAAPQKTPTQPKATAPVMKMEHAPKPQKSGPGLLFYLLAALVIGGGLYWFLFKEQTPQRTDQVAASKQTVAEHPRGPGGGCQFGEKIERPRNAVRVAPAVFLQGRPLVPRR